MTDVQEAPARTKSELAKIRTDVVGSLLRPAVVKDARIAFDDGKITAEALHAIEDEAVRQAVRLQENAGLDVISDGEMRRLNFQDSFGASVEGYDAARSTLKVYEQRVEGSAPGQRWDIPTMHHAGTAVSHRRPAKSRLQLAHNVPLEEYQFVSKVAKKPVKVSLIGPDRISQRFEYENSTAVYRDMDAFLADVVAIERRDCNEPGRRRLPLCSHRRAGVYRLYRSAVARPDARTRRGSNAELRSIAQGGSGSHCQLSRRHLRHSSLPRQSTQHVAPRRPYDAIAERLFNELPHDRFLLEYDTPRAGSFEPLRFVPKGKVVVLGLVSTKTPELETIDHLKRRIEEASRCIPLDQLAISPQCGFASDVVGNLLSPDDQKRKLERVVETARAVWG